MSDEPLGYYGYGTAPVRDWDQVGTIFSQSAVRLIPDYMKHKINLNEDFGLYLQAI